MRWTKKQFKEYEKAKEQPLIRVTPKILVGVDPGENTGLAKMEREGQRIVGFTFCKCVDFWSGYEWLIELDPAETLVVIENGGLRNYSHHRADLKVREQLMQQYGKSDPEKERQAQDRVSRNVGAANRDAALLIAGLLRKGYAVVQVMPYKTKWTQEELLDFTGYSQSTNQHVRDAMRLAWDKRDLLRTAFVEYRQGVVL